MANWDRNDEYGNRGMGGHRDGGFFDRAGNALRRAFQGQDMHQAGMSDHMRQDYENRSTMDAGGNYGGTNRGGGGRNYTSGANAWTDGAWTADAADRLDRDVDLGGNRGSDTSPFHAGWYGPQGRDMGARDMGRGYDSGYQGGGTNQGGLGRDRGWNLGTGDAEWGHNWGSGRMGGSAGNGYMGGGMDRGRAMGGHDQGGGWMDRAQNAVRRGWDQVENAFDRDDDRTMGHGARGGYGRDFGGRGMMGGSTGGMRQGGDTNRGAGWNTSRGRGQYDNGYQGATGAGGIGNEPYYGNMNSDQYDRGYRGYGRGRDGY